LPPARRAHLDEPIALAHLCSIARVDARGLQKAFVKRRGMTPMQWVKDRRMATARLRLAKAAPSATVTKIALASGFTQLGRFAVDYRRRYGESPSETARWIASAESTPRKRAPGTTEASGA
jgi:transcriptional regulator GlxA family with amidase domain